MIYSCGACGAATNGGLAMTNEGLRVKLPKPWTGHNAAVNDRGGPGPAAVFLCSEDCVALYAAEIGLMQNPNRERKP